MNTGKVGIVLVNYNGGKCQNDCIRTIREMDYNNYEIIVVDNDSKDDSVKKLREEFDGIVIIETGENNGVAKGNNIGIKKALELDCEYVLLLNNDTEVHKEMLTLMMEKASEDTLVTCKMYYYDPKDVLWYAGGRFDWGKATTIHIGENEKDEGQYDESQFTEYTPTCCLLIHNKVFEKVGFMDENYFIYYDDSDFIARVNKAGLKIWYEAKAKLWHKVSSSTGGSESRLTVYYATRNRLYFIDKFYDNKFGVLSYFAVTRTIRLIKYFFKDRKIAKALLKSISDYRHGRMYRQNF